MRHTAQIIVVFNLFLLAAVTESLNAQPNLPIERIPGGTPDDVRQKIEGLYAENPVVRALAARDLGAIGEPRAAAAVPFLTALLNDYSPLERRMDATLPGYGEPTSPRSEARKALLRMPKAAAEHLSQVVAGEPEPFPSCWATGAEIFGQVAGAEAVPILARYREHADRATRNCVITGLGNTRSEKAIPYLLGALKDSDYTVRRAAVQGLGSIGHADTVPSLLTCLKDEESGVRGDAAEALASVGDTRAILPLVDLLLSEKHYPEQLKVVRALGKFKLRAQVAVELLITRLHSKETYPSVKEAIAESLAKITGQQFGLDAEKWSQWYYHRGGREVRLSARTAFIQVPAANPLAAGPDAPSGNLDILVFAPDFWRAENPPRALLVKAEGLSRQETDKELLSASFAGLEPPVRVTGLRPGKYSVGIRIPLRRSEGMHPIPKQEMLAWDGVVEDYIKGIDPEAGLSYIFYVFWYNATVQPDRTAIVSALVFLEDEALNGKLWQCVSEIEPRYQVNGNFTGEELVYGLERDRLDDVLHRAAKAFCPQGFFKSDQSPVGVIYIEQTDSGKVSFFGRLRALDDSQIERETHVNVESQGVERLTRFDPLLDGKNEVRIRNPNDFVVDAFIRSGVKGRDLQIPSKEARSAWVPDGRYDVYFRYSTKPDALFQGDSFTLEGNGVEIQIVKVVGGNYRIRQVK